ncbi:hypothetical protein TBLA_0H00470 [Henningerozyma blattae CBS 6284]|uniref:Uncharacterized protein n=1 Tax=Henningerozyma blattae (strain ATCC 34711 / CBS 6284 / DSM 70876 / NBRC 10599 / NRRL Y-10934 / UCD 77-7) TaxID=1071380 RepID=I2H7I8_HENB6|nr:hypothetical protein TBLA_0H00470 [Tetrapisispora blattae CBS 6284]CCH62340.1 hypothetical protein TBLA_0H00470 [Tetrapisispora blattae CBS 6284]
MFIKETNFFLFSTKILYMLLSFNAIVEYFTKSITGLGWVSFLDTREFDPIVLPILNIWDKKLLVLDQFFTKILFAESPLETLIISMIIFMTHQLLTHISIFNLLIICDILLFTLPKYFLRNELGFDSFIFNNRTKTSNVRIFFASTRGKEKLSPKQKTASVEQERLQLAEPSPISLSHPIGIPQLVSFPMSQLNDGECKLGTENTLPRTSSKEQTLHTSRQNTNGLPILKENPTSIESIYRNKVPNATAPSLDIGELMQQTHIQYEQEYISDEEKNSETVGNDYTTVSYNYHPRTNMLNEDNVPNHLASGKLKIKTAQNPFDPLYDRQSNNPSSIILPNSKNKNEQSSTIV